ncbi:hypothetical protein EPN52_08255 [bacterium]|nr:MAG: hypothetical protein EPN52_08255 [bacterium]
MRASIAPARRSPATFENAGAGAGLLATLWLALLWLGAPLLGAASREGATLAERAALRTRNAIALGVGIPFVLGFAHALYGEICLIAALPCVVLAWRPAAQRTTAARHAPLSRAWVWLTIVTAALVLLLWPQLLRPPLEGDTLAYHLPNAFAWARTHTLWVTGTRYWWYPGGSELFAAGMIAVGARWSLPLAGGAAALLLTLRIVAFAARRSSATAVTAAGALCAVALLTTPVAAGQVGTLQNDLWLAAATLEVLWSLLYARSSRALLVSVGLCALIKPLGAVVALAAGVAYFVARVAVQRGEPPFSSRAIDVAGGFLPLLLWIVRDVLLAPGALSPIASKALAEPWGSTIAGQGLTGLTTLLRALAAAGAATIAFALIPFVALGEFFVRSLRARLGAEGLAFGTLSLTGVLVSGLYLAAPFGFAGSVPQLANGASLRFDLPALACACAVVALFAARAPLLVGGLALLSSLFGVARFQALFWNDAPTRSALPAAFTCALLVAVLAWVVFWHPDWKRWAALFGTACAAALLCVGVWLSSTRAVAFYDEGMRSDPSGVPTGLFSRLVQLRPPALVALDVRAGSISMLLPRTTVYDALDSQPCAQARRLGALLVVGTDRDTPAAVRAARRTLALHACGRVVYADRAAVIASPL